MAKKKDSKSKGKVKKAVKQEAPTPPKPQKVEIGFRLTQDLTFSYGWGPVTIHEGYLVRKGEYLPETYERIKRMAQEKGICQIVEEEIDAHG